MTDETEQKEEEQTEESGSQSSDGEPSAAEKAQEEHKEREEAAEQLEKLEDDPPSDLDQWPSDKGKYLTFGGSEGEMGYDEAATRNLGPSEVRHHEDGNVSVQGEQVDDPSEYKGDPIPGGPTDPNVPDSQKGTAADDEDEGGSDDDDE